MTMNYQKMNLQSFQQRLREGVYKGITGARRAIGKADWDETEANKAYELANKHFKVKADAARTPRPAAARADSRAKGSRNPTATVTNHSSDSVTRADKPVQVSTNAELIELCGTANDLTETIRKAAEVHPPSRDVLEKAANVLFQCLEHVAGALKGRPASTRAVAKSVTQLTANAVKPQAHIGRRDEDNGEERSAAAAR